MGLDFNILWIEDQLDNLETDKEDVEDFLSENGFRPRTTVLGNGSDLGAVFEAQRLYAEFDLVIVDYDLGKDARTGDEVVSDIRREFSYIDIIFYSSISTLDLRKKIFDLRVDGVYCVHRGDLRAVLLERVEETVKSLSRLTHIRGIAVSVVGECDAHLRKIISTLHAAGRGGTDFSPEEYLTDRIGKRLEEKVEKLASLGELPDCLEHQLVQSSNLCRLASRMTSGDESLGTYNRVLGDYVEQVLQPRNALGHASEKRDADGWKIIGRGGDPITNEEIPGLRKNFVRHLDNLERLAAAVQSD